MRLFLIRHGQTPSNVLGAIDTAVPGPSLTDVGQQQAKAVGALLAPHPISAVYASSQLRAQQTAQPLATHRAIDVKVRDGLREIFAGEFEMLTDRDAITSYVETCRAWVSGDLERRMPGGESGEQVFRRFDEVIDEIAQSGHENIAVVSHGAMLRTWVAHTVKNLDPRFVNSNPLPNTGVVVLTGTTQAWSAESWLGEPAGAVAPHA